MYAKAADGACLCKKLSDKKGGNASDLARWIGLDQAAYLKVSVCSFVCACFVVGASHTHTLACIVVVASLFPVSPVVDSCAAL